MPMTLLHAARRRLPCTLLLVVMVVDTVWRLAELWVLVESERRWEGMCSILYSIGRRVRASIMVGILVCLALASRKAVNPAGLRRTVPG